MSTYASGATLDAPDQDLRTIQTKLWQGQKLTRNEQIRWANRLAVEKETQRTGGALKGSVSANTMPSAYDAGRNEAQQAVDYMRGRDEVLGGGVPSAVPGGGQPPMRRSPISNNATVEEKIDDNEVGPHRTADGQPGTWNVPKQISGRYNGGTINGGPSLPAGTISMQGADGQFKVWQGGKFTNDRFGSLEDVAQNRPSNPSAPISDAAVRETLPPATRGPRMDAMSAAPSSLPIATRGPRMDAGAPPTRTIADDKAYIRGAGYGDFLEGMEPQANPSLNAAASAWFGQGGMMPRGGVNPRPMPTAPAQPVPMIDQSRMTPVAQSVPVIDMSQMSPVPTPRNWNPYSLGPGRASAVAPKQFQAAAEQFNPFGSTTPERRRTVSVLPE